MFDFTFLDYLAIYSSLIAGLCIGNICYRTTQLWSIKARTRMFEAQLPVVIAEKEVFEAATAQTKNNIVDFQLRMADNKGMSDDTRKRMADFLKGLKETLSERTVE